jgi:hypothetical protein
LVILDLLSDGTGVDGLTVLSPTFVSSGPSVPGLDYR